MLDDLGRPTTGGYLSVQLAELRSAVTELNDDHIITIIDNIRAEAGDTIAFAIVADLLRKAHNTVTDPASSACIDTALARYRARYWNKPA